MNVSLSKSWGWGAGNRPPVVGEELFWSCDHQRSIKTKRWEQLCTPWLCFGPLSNAENNWAADSGQCVTHFLRSWKAVHSGRQADCWGHPSPALTSLKQENKTLCVQVSHLQTIWPQGRYGETVPTHSSVSRVLLHRSRTVSLPHVQLTRAWFWQFMFQVERNILMEQNGTESSDRTELHDGTESPDGTELPDETERPFGTDPPEGFVAIFIVKQEVKGVTRCQASSRCQHLQVTWLSSCHMMSVNNIQPHKTNTLWHLLISALLVWLIVLMTPVGI